MHGVLRDRCRLRRDGRVDEDPRHSDAGAVGIAVHVTHGVTVGIQCVRRTVNAVHRVVTNNIVRDVGDGVIVDCLQL